MSKQLHRPQGNSLSEERFRKIFEIASDGIIYMDTSGRIVDVNEQAVRIFGGSKEDLIGKHFTRVGVVSSADLPRITKTFAGILLGRGTPLEVQIRNKKGEMRFLECSYSVMKTDGKLVGILAIARDVTERKKIEERLRKSEERFRGIAERSFDVIVTTDCEGRITYISPSVERILGFRAEEMIGKPFQECFVGSGLSDAMQIFARLLKGETVESLQLETLRKDGSLASIEVNVSPIMANGEVVGIQGIARDISERKRMIEALRESEEKIRNIFESSPDGITVSDLSGRIVDCNQASLRLQGYSNKEEFVGRNSFELIAAKDRERAVENLKRIQEQGLIKNDEYTLVTKDGKEFPAEISASTIRGISGEPRYFVAIVKDITERKLLEEKIKESEDRLRQLVEYAPDAIYTNDLNGVFRDGNRQAESLTGYKKEELAGKNIIEVGLLSEKYLPMVMEDLARNRQGLQTGPREYELKRKDGNTIWAEISTFPVKRGGEVEVLGIARDITERKRMEEQLRESEERLRGIAERSFDAIVAMDLEGRVTFISFVAERVLGYKPEEIKGKSFHTFFAERGISKAVQAFAEVVNGKSVRGLELELLRKDGSSVTVEMNGVPVIKNGKVVGVQAIARDVSERKKMEDALRESEEKIRNILQSSPDAITASDLNGNIIDCNQASLEMHGDSRKEDLLGKNISALVAKKDHERLTENMKTIFERGELRNMEYTLLKSDGREFPGEISTSLARDTLGNPKYLVAMIKDISERKQMQQKLQEYSEQLEALVEKRTRQLKEAQEQLLKSERLAAIGQVAAMVGHDLRNPLTGIKGAAYYLKARPALKRNKKTREMLELIEKDIEYSNKIITDLLEYSREVHLELTETTPKSITSETLSLLEVPKNVQVVDLTQSEPKIKVDIEKFNRVFVNLIKNAIDAMPYGGRLTIKSTRTNDKIEFSFTDTGMGMTKEQMGRVWAPFFTTKAKGMGLGLSICKRIVEAHRGQISLESTAGIGTTFTVTIPVEPKTTEGGEEVWVNAPESLLSTTTKASEKS